MLEDYVHFCLKECLEKVKIKDEVDTLEIEYQQKNFSFGKNDPLRLITLCCIINQYINDVLKKLEEEMTKKFDKKLIRLYVQCEKVVVAILYFLFKNAKIEILIKKHI